MGFQVSWWTWHLETVKISNNLLTSSLSSIKFPNRREVLQRGQGGEDHRCSTMKLLWFRMKNMRRGKTIALTLLGISRWSSRTLIVLFYYICCLTYKMNGYNPQNPPFDALSTMRISTRIELPSIVLMENLFTYGDGRVYFPAALRCDHPATIGSTRAATEVNSFHGRGSPSVEAATEKQRENVASFDEVPDEIRTHER